MASETPDLPGIDYKYCSNNFDLQTPAECTLANGSPCRPCVRRLKLEAHIEETKKRLDELIMEESQARMESSYYHRPYLRLPTEIISHIFCFTAPDFELQGRTVDRDDTHSELGVLVLGAVCQRWRSIAWSTPLLWSNIMLNVTKSPTDDMIEVMQQWLQRSTELPLSIRLGVYNTSPGQDLQTLRFIGSLNEHSARWQDLSIRCDEELFEHFEGNADDGSSKLQTLQLICLSDGPNQGEPVFKLNMATPQLDHIIAVGFKSPCLEDIEVSWDNTTSVTFEGLDISDSIKLVSICPRLVNLRLQHICDAFVLDDSVRIQPVNPHLRTLYLSTSSSYAVNSILAKIKLPSLEVLDIHGLSDSTRRRENFDGTILALPSSSIPRFLQRSSCSLTSLTLQRIKCDEQKILFILYSLPPSVNHLQLDIRLDVANVRESDADLDIRLLFNHLSRRRTAFAIGGGSSRLDLLPNLERFKYHVFEKTEIPWDLLPGIARPVSGEKRPLKELSIVKRQTDDKSGYHGQAGSSIFARSVRGGKISKSTIRDLIGLQDDGVDLFFPNKLSRQFLSKLIEDEDE